MLQYIEDSHAASLSGRGTSAHETGTTSLCLTGNPYTDFASLGLDLHNCRIHYRSEPNAQGATVTGTFNISGTGYTMGATSYPDLIRRVYAKWQEKQDWHRRVRAEKRLRNTLAYIDRHPDAMVLPAWLS